MPINHSQSNFEKLTEFLPESSISCCKEGEVYLVGAGPGDPELLTIKALKLLRFADVILYDRLISSEILSLASSDARLIDVGKARANHTLPQNEINELLVEFAKKGHKVVRLKGGDPFIFGRGGEELEYLVKENIPFQIVPGVSAANGCAAYAGIPLTHRDYSQSVRFVTAHLKNNTFDLPWSNLVLDKQTLVFYMGLLGVSIISRKLIEHGMLSDTPIALISQGTTPRQKILVSSLGEIAEGAVNIALPSPTIIIVGNVVALHREFYRQSEFEKI